MGDFTLLSIIAFINSVSQLFKYKVIKSLPHSFGMLCAILLMLHSMVSMKSAFVYFVFYCPIPTGYISAYIRSEDKLCLSIYFASISSVPTTTRTFMRVISGSDVKKDMYHSFSFSETFVCVFHKKEVRK